jgi:DNA-binding FadR family transcriptional regulator
MADDNIVINTLVTEYVKARNRVEGAAARIAFSERQLEAEHQLHKGFLSEMADLEAAIIKLGGHLPPPPDEDTRAFGGPEG